MPAAGPTRLNYADELLTTLVGALGVTWSTVESLDACASAVLASGERSRQDETAKGRWMEDEAAETRKLAEVLAVLVPRPAGGDGPSRETRQAPGH